MLRQLVNFEQKKYKNNIHTDKKKPFYMYKSEAPAIGESVYWPNLFEAKLGIIS